MGDAQPQVEVYTYMGSWSGRSAGVGVEARCSSTCCCLSKWHTEDGVRRREREKREPLYEVVADCFPLPGMAMLVRSVSSRVVMFMATTISISLFSCFSLFFLFFASLFTIAIIKTLFIASTSLHCLVASTSCRIASVPLAFQYKDHQEKTRKRCGANATRSFLSSQQ